MRKYIFTLLFLLFTVPAFAKVDFVIDLDGTLVDEWKPSMGRYNTVEVDFSFQGAQLHQKYRIIDGAGEFIQALLNIPDSRVSVFSAGAEERNTALLKNIMLPNGQSAYDALSPRIFSFQHTTRPNGAEGTLGKDLRTIGNDVDLDKAILIDDQLGYPLPGQERNLLWLPDTLVKYPGTHLYDLHQVGKKVLFLPNLENTGPPPTDQATVTAGTHDKNRLLRAMGMIDYVLEQSKKSGLSPVTILAETQWNGKFGLENYQNQIMANPDLFVRGIRRFKAAHSDYIPLIMTGFDRDVECLRQLGVPEKMEAASKVFMSIVDLANH